MSELCLFSPTFLSLFRSDIPDKKDYWAQSHMHMAGLDRLVRSAYRG